MYFYNTQTCIFTTLKTEQQYLNTATKRAPRSFFYEKHVFMSFYDMLDEWMI